MSLINGHELSKEDFCFDIEEPGCFLTKKCIKQFILKLEKKLSAKTKYIEYVDYSVDFRHAISLQIHQLARAIENGDAKLYQPITIR